MIAEGTTSAYVAEFFVALHCFSFVGLNTPSLPAQGKQRLLQNFNRDRNISRTTVFATHC